jgi:tetratricopeptide (TPR) repeat protein
MAMLGPAYLRCGRAAEAATMLEQALSAFKAMQIRGSVPFNMSLLAEVYLDQGRIDDARELAEQALALARTQHEQGWQAWCLKTLGDVRALELEDPEPARSAYHQAHTIATELTLRPLAAHCHLGLGKLASRSGQREAAKEHLGAAVTLYRDMGMSYWLGGAESELQSLD